MARPYEVEYPLFRYFNLIIISYIFLIRQKCFSGIIKVYKYKIYLDNEASNLIEIMHFINVLSNILQCTFLILFISRMEKRLTFDIKSKFNNLHINEIREWNCDDIKRSLSVAMKKAHAPEKLHLQFEGKMNATMIEMTEDYKDKITSLGIWAEYNEDLLLQPSFIFKSLEGLSLSRCTDDTIVRVCEAMLAKHANNLKKLRIITLMKNLRVPNLPELDSLTLNYVDEEAAWNILENCRPTITRFNLRRTKINPQPLSSNSAAYEIPNIKHLRIVYSKAFNFVKFNAEHLVSLELRDIYDYIPNNVEWPQFPKLRELKISGSKYLPIIMNSRETLENLYISNIYAPSDYASVLMPKLTDLHQNSVDNAFTSKICSSNHTSLEFMYLKRTDLPNLDDGIKMERMRNVVLGTSYTAQDRERMIGMCLNAEVVILSQGNRKEIRDQMRSRFKSKNFSLDFIDIQF